MEARDRLEQQVSVTEEKLAESDRKAQKLDDELREAQRQREDERSQLNQVIQLLKDDNARLKSAADGTNRRAEEQKARNEQEIAELHKQLNSAQSAFEDGVHCMLDQATGDAERLQLLERENQTLKRMVVDQTENAERLSKQNARIQTLDSRLFALASENSELKKQ